MSGSWWEDPTLEATEGAAPVQGLQAVLDPRGGMTDPRAKVQVLLDATRRTAIIEIGGMPRGTGFLVGADLLLTAAHVIAPHRAPGRLEGVEAVFDVCKSGFHAPAEVGSRVMVTAFVAGRLPTEAEKAGQLGGPVPADRLDYALLRLARPVATERAKDGGPDAAPRGSYPMWPSPYAFEQAHDLFIVQHALGEPLTTAPVARPYTLNDNKTRVTYGGNTGPGSSGSPIIDGRGRLVALHHGSAALNQGVPIAAIARDLAEQGFARLVGTADPVRAPSPPALVTPDGPPARDVAAEIVDLLRRSPSLVPALAERGYPRDPAELARALAGAPALSVARALARIARAPGSRAHARDLLCLVLPVAADWADVIERVGASRASRTPLILRLQTDTIAEIVVAREEDRRADLVPVPGRVQPRGAACFPMPAASLAPLPTSTLAEAILDNLIEAGPPQEGDPGYWSKLSRDYKSPDRYRAHARARINAAIDDETGPYLLVIDRDIDEHHASDRDAWWNEALALLQDERRGLPGLRLIRLKDSDGDTCGEIDVVPFIEKIYGSGS